MLLTHHLIYLHMGGLLTPSIIQLMFLCGWRIFMLSSLDALKKWVSRTDIQTFDILLCIGNKVDLLPGHSAHVGYRRRLQKLEESWSNTFLESDYGISETEGSSY